MRKIKDFDYCISRNGDVFSIKTSRFLKPCPLGRGYLSVRLYSGGNGSTKLVHRLLAEAYIDNPDNLPTVNHKDGDKLNNRLSNLEWMSYSDNNQHAVDTGLRGDTRVLDLDVAYKMFQMIMDGHRAKDVRDSLGINDSKYRWYVYSDSYADIREMFDWENRPRRSASISHDKVIEICKMLEKGITPKKISSAMNISTKNIYNIKRRVTYRMISESFSF